MKLGVRGRARRDQLSIWRPTHGCYRTLQSLQPGLLTSYFPQLGAQEPDNTGRRRPRDHAGRVDCPEKHTSAAPDGKLGRGQRLPGEAGDALDEEKFIFGEIERKYLHAGELEQWLGRAVITGDHSHRVVVVANGKFVSVGVPG